MDGYWFCGYWLTGHKERTSSWKEKLFKPTLNIDNFLGINGTRWTVFSPNITRNDCRILVSVEADDGKKRIWLFPNVDRFSKFSDTVRKYKIDPKFKVIGGRISVDIAHYAARMFDAHDFHPTKASVIREAQEISISEVSPYKVVRHKPYQETLLTCAVRGAENLH